MKAAIVTAYGSPHSIVIKEVSTPVPTATQVLVKLTASTVSSADNRILHANPPLIRLVYGISKPRKGILGSAFSGVVEKVGDEVTDFMVGQSVFGTTDAKMGTHAEYVCMSEKALVLPLAKEVDLKQAACLSFGFSTALYFLRKAGLKEGDKLLIIGAAGALGTAAIQLAGHRKAKITAVCGPEDLNIVKSLGAQQTIDYTTADYGNYGSEYDVIFDTVGKIPIRVARDLLAKEGRFVSSVHMALSRIVQGRWYSMTTSKKLMGGLSIENKKDLTHLSEMLAAKAIQPVIGHETKLDTIAEAYEVMNGGHKVGNNVVTF